MTISLNDLHAAHGKTSPAAEPRKPEATAKFRGSSRPASPAQFAKIKHLLEQGKKHDPEAIEAARRKAQAGLLTSREASRIIDTLLAAPSANRYPGQCILCQVRVGAEEGLLQLSDEGKWEVFHADGECPTAFPFPVGRYALDLDGSIHFFVFREESISEQAGDTLYPVGGPRRKQVTDLIAADPEAASRLYGREIGHCGRCNRSLTDEASRAAGIGPKCASRGW